MHIVDRQTFLSLPSGTIFCKFAPQPSDGSFVDQTHEEVAIKGETIGTDFVVQETFPWFEGALESGANGDVIDRMLAGEPSPPVEYEFAGRDGLFDQDQLFAVWNAEDARRLVQRLQLALSEGYTSAP